MPTDPPVATDPPVPPPGPPGPARSRRRRWATDLAILGAVLIGGHAYTSRGTISGPAPELSGVGLNGAGLSLGSLKGQPVLVQFWATWCPVCHQEAPSIDRLANDHRILTVAVSSGGPDSVAAFQAQRGHDWPVLADPAGRLAAAWGVNAYPSSFIIDAAGTVRFVEVGYTTELGLRARLWLASLFASA